MMRGWLAAFLACIAFLCVAARVDAVIFYATPGRNTAAPTGALANSGWQYQGNWGTYLGTPIASNYFITAGHVGRSVGQGFVYQGQTYTTTAIFDDPNSDLRIWKVGGTFSSYAPLYTSLLEAAQPMVVFGRGTQRGVEVTSSGELKGWKWGTNDHVKSWGQNTIDGVFAAGTGVGQLLKFDFDAIGVSNEATLSNGDSGGGVFVLDGGVWKLAGINYGVENPWSLNGNSGSGFSAAIFDKGGLYSGGDGEWHLESNSIADKPANAYATRVSSNSAWIYSVIGPPNVLPSFPEPSCLALIIFGAVALLGRKRGQYVPINSLEGCRRKPSFETGIQAKF